MQHDELGGRGIYSHNEIDQALSPPEFTTVTAFSGTWVSFSDSYPPRYSKDGLGWVTLYGQVKDGTINTGAFVLPVGFRPAYADSWAVDSYGAFGRVSVYTNGNVIPRTGDTRGVSLAGIRFHAG